MSEVTWTKTEMVEVPKPVSVEVTYWVLSRLDLNTRNKMAKLYYYGFVDEASFKAEDSPVLEKETLVDLTQVSELEETLTAIVQKVAGSL